MAHQLHLLRHAKSSRDDPGLSDHERPLAERGVRATKVLGEHVRDLGLAPDVVLCSSAVRAMQTLEGVRAGLPSETEVEVDDGLYGAEQARLLDRLRGLSEETGSAMLVGHNPAIEELARELAGGGDAGVRARIEVKYPTGGLASLHFDASWRDLGPGQATLDSFVVPKDLG